MNDVSLSDQEFALFQRFIHDTAGISMSSAKKALVSGRLSKRLRHCGVNSYAEYFRVLCSGDAPAEVQTAVDLLTTNETYFFREPKHFEFLHKQASVHGRSGLPFRVWSAASSTGEEAYSTAMVLADCLPGGHWEVVGSDISTRVLQRARTGHYPLDRARMLPQDYLRRFCLKGVGEQAGTLLVARELRRRVRFLQANLNADLPDLGQFDLIFLRNVMIYFDTETKRQVVARVLAKLRPGGHFCIGHSETLNDISDAVRAIAPSVYRKD